MFIEKKKQPARTCRGRAFTWASRRSCSRLWPCTRRCPKRNIWQPWRGGGTHGKRTPKIKRRAKRPQPTGNHHRRVALLSACADNGRLGSMVLNVSSNRGQCSDGGGVRLVPKYKTRLKTKTEFSKKKNRPKWSRSVVCLFSYFPSYLRLSPAR